MSGESSVTYLVHCQVPQRIFSSCGMQAKIVMLLRNPIDRFVSNFLMRVRVSDYGNTITEITPIRSIMEEEMRSFHSIMSNISFPNVQQGWKNILCKFRPTESMIFEGMYYVHLLNWMCNFPAENILIINSEEFSTSWYSIFRKCKYMIICRRTKPTLPATPLMIKQSCKFVYFCYGWQSAIMWTYFHSQQYVS